MFVAHGPFSTNVKDVHSKRSWMPSRTLSRMLSRAPDRRPGWDSVKDSAYVMDGFQNVEIYGLVMRLLGITDSCAKHNGTAGFWDKYF